MVKLGKILFLTLILVVISFLAGYLVHAPKPYVGLEHGSSAVTVYYSPATDLEKIDISILETAQHSIDASEYALTDVALADELVKKAHQGVHIRLYRDLRQYEDETRNSNDAMSHLVGVKGIEIRVKHSSVLAHLKAYQIDGSTLREGSANWSPSGEQKQDNSLLLIHSVDAAGTFERNFNIIWARPDNHVIQ